MDGTKNVYGEVPAITKVFAKLASAKEFSA
jgi:hypothetical protein